MSKLRPFCILGQNDPANKARNRPCSISHAEKFTHWPKFFASFQQYTCPMLCEKLLQLTPDHRPTLVLLSKIAIRLGQWTKAEEIINSLRALHSVDVPYLTGFMLWKRGKLVEAVVAFRSAIASGHHAPEAYHGLASSLFQLENLPEAEKAVKQGLRLKTANKLLLDLGAQIAIATRQYEEAERYIQRLGRLTEDDTYHHRKATLLSARKKFKEALFHAHKAADVPRPRFEVLASRAHIYIELGDYDSATHELQRLDTDFRFSSDKQDVKVGLRCKLQLRREDWQQAELLWEQLNHKDSPVHTALRMEILRQKAADPKVSPGQRVTAEAELLTLRESRAFTLPIFWDDLESAASDDSVDAESP